MILQQSIKFIASFGLFGKFVDFQKVCSSLLNLLFKPRTKSYT
jgi:hypothetical protein